MNCPQCHPKQKQHQHALCEYHFTQEIKKEPPPPRREGERIKVGRQKSNHTL